MNKYILLVWILTPMFLIAQGPIVETNSGKVEGVLLQENIKVFKGIPYAEPPINELRWKAPIPKKPWKDIKKCYEFGASPMQAKPTPFMFWPKEYLIPEAPISEDCLYLNVWTKSIKKEVKKPVLVYIYGGGFRSGGSGCPIYDGTSTAKKDVVFVSINYRVGVFGFMAHPELTAESKNKSSGNYALLDMIAALKWVKGNISAFGGDPNNVTIAGQSAGAFAVNYLTTSPLAKGLFHKAIAESGGSFRTQPNRPKQNLASAETTGLEYANELKVNSLKELRKMSAEELLAQSGGTSWPVIDGYIIPKSIYNTYKEGIQNDVPMLMGWNKDDLVGSGNRSSADYKAWMISRFGGMADTFLEQYPGDSDKEASIAQKHLGRDETFGLQVYTWAGMQSTTGSSKVYLYNFNRNLPFYDESTNFGAFHSSEIVYAYDNLNTSDRPWEKIDYKIANTMSTYWTNFVKYGNPNGKNLPIWNAYNSINNKVVIIDKRIETKQLPDLGKMKVWDSYYRSIEKD
ncbi:para-nitrobenzyl esterase [Saonia flava]|uniref:Carboxylic ester hydrolase n=1 Tax=Saonia flava TaxID=523696 RepID=A0A846QQ28_9FLAO|nr:carboxylesterase family protein [Saonia flava]NJB70191.1 para-nitrobenzyl esterase [Saonia flava]